MHRSLHWIALFLLVVGSLLAADAPAPAGGASTNAVGKGDDAKNDDAKKETPPVVTQGSVTIGGKTIDYQAAAGMLPILGKDGKPTAQVFYIAYTQTNKTDAADRPVTYCFNGGPGSSSVRPQLQPVRVSPSRTTSACGRTLRSVTTCACREHPARYTLRSSQLGRSVGNSDRPPLTMRIS